MSVWLFCTIIISSTLNLVGVLPGPPVSAGLSSRLFCCSGPHILVKSCSLLPVFPLERLLPAPLCVGGGAHIHIHACLFGYLSGHSFRLMHFQTSHCKPNLNFNHKKQVLNEDRWTFIFGSYIT